MTPARSVPVPDMTNRKVWIVAGILLLPVLLAGCPDNGGAPRNRWKANAPAARPGNGNAHSLLAAERQKLKHLHLIAGSWDLARFAPHGGADHPLVRAGARLEFQTIMLEEDGTMACETLVEPAEGHTRIADASGFTRPGTVGLLSQDSLFTRLESHGAWTATLAGKRLRLHFRFRSGEKVELDAVLQAPPGNRGRFVLRLAGNPVLAGNCTTELARYE